MVWVVVCGSYSQHSLLALSSAAGSEGLTRLLRVQTTTEAFMLQPSESPYQVMP